MKRLDQIEWGDDRLPDRFWDKVHPEPNTGCWLWAASSSGGGYGGFYWRVDGEAKMRGAHRVSYSELWGPIPDGWDIDHLCRVHWCVRPSHLEPVTHRVNMERSIVGDLNRAAAAERERCAHGHQYTAENVYRAPSGMRGCKACRRATLTAARRRRGVPTLAERYSTCRKGHAWTAATTIWTRDGYRKCRICRDATNRRRSRPGA